MVVAFKCEQKNKQTNKQTKNASIKRVIGSLKSRMETFICLSKMWLAL